MAENHPRAQISCSPWNGVRGDPRLRRGPPRACAQRGSPLDGPNAAAARRFLLTLVKLGYVNFSQGRFSLRPRVLELGYAYLSSLSLPEVAMPHMETLVAEVNESCSISVLDETDIVYVARVPTRRIMSITLAVGTRLPAFVTSMGRVLLAGLPEDELEERLARIEVCR